MWAIGTWSVLIMPIRLAHEGAFQNMRSPLQDQCWTALPRRGDHLDSCYRRTSMLLKHVSVRVSSGKTYLPMRRCRAVTGRGSEARRNAMREREVFLPFRLTSTAPALYIVFPLQQANPLN